MIFLGTRSDNNIDKTKKGRNVALSGEAAGSSKLTRIAVDEIRSSYQGGTSVSSLARNNGVSRRAIRFIITGETWVG
jgi:hypothetical protein